MDDASELQLAGDTYVWPWPVLTAVFLATGTLAAALQAILWAYERQIIGAQLEPGHRLLLSGPVGVARLTQAIALGTASLAGSVLLTRSRRRWSRYVESRQDLYDGYSLRS